MAIEGLQGKIDTDVSRETLERFAELIKKWNPAINLISKASLLDMWKRHFADSLQLYALIPDSANLCMDIGSGGGFPGVVLAIASRNLNPSRKFILVESDQRKAAFLREASRQLDLDLNVVSNRVEALEPQGADVLSARALAPLSQLLEWGNTHLNPHGVCIFPKGVSYQQELDDARIHFNFDCEVIQSQTDPKGAILKISRINHV